MLAAQSLTGKVVSKADQQPVPGVSVQIKGTKKGTATDMNGQFSINAKAGDVLVLTTAGFIEKEFSVTGNAEVVIELEVNPKYLNDVVVTALGVKKDKKIIGYSTQ